MDTPIANDLALEWRDGQYWIVEYAVLENGSRVEMYHYQAHDEQVAQIRHWSSWPPGSSASSEPPNEQERLRLFLAEHPKAFVMDIMAEFDLTESEVQAARRRVRPPLDQSASQRD